MLRLAGLLRLFGLLHDLDPSYFTDRRPPKWAKTVDICYPLPPYRPTTPSKIAQSDHIGPRFGRNTVLFSRFPPDGGCRLVKPVDTLVIVVWGRLAQS